MAISTGFVRKNNAPFKGHTGLTAFFQTPIEQLELRYRTALSGAVVAEACFLARLGEPHATPAAIARARWKWERIESRKRALAVQVSALRVFIAGIQEVVSGQKRGTTGTQL